MVVTDPQCALARYHKYPLLEYNEYLKSPFSRNALYQGRRPEEVAKEVCKGLLAQYVY